MVQQVVLAAVTRGLARLRSTFPDEKRHGQQDQKGAFQNFAHQKILLGESETAEALKHVADLRQLTQAVNQALQDYLNEPRLQAFATVNLNRRPIILVVLR